MSKKEKDIGELRVKSKGPIAPEDEVKVKKTIRLDYPVFEWLLKESEAVGLPYQSLINSLLTKAMKQKSLEERLLDLETKMAKLEVG